MPKPGDTINQQFVLRRELGRGAHGTVFEAKQLGLERTVAVKMLLPQALGNVDLVARFKREARLASSLTSPHSVIIHAFGVHSASADDDEEDQVPYLVMEYLHGEDLQNYLSVRGTLSVDETVLILHQVLSSLSEAHRKGIVHRDLKPENLFLSQRDDAFVVKVLDFGIAKAMEDKEVGGRHVTQDGMVCGTPEYMSPEQAMGQEITPAADIYALGCILFHVLTGSPPFSGNSAMTIALKHCQDEAPPLPADLKGTPLGQLVERAMAKDPTERFANASEMAQALEEMLGPMFSTHSSGAWKPLQPEQAASNVGNPVSLNNVSLNNVAIPDWALATTPSMNAFKPGSQKGPDVPAHPMGELGDDQIVASADALFSAGNSSNLANLGGLGGGLQRGGEDFDDFEESDVPTIMDPNEHWSVRGEPTQDPPDSSRDQGGELATSPGARQARRPARGGLRKSERNLFIGLFVALASLLVLVTVTVLVLVVLSKPAPKTTRPSRSVVKDTVTFRVDSNPRGADVFEGDELLGETPLTFQRPRSESELLLTLRRPGYKSREVTLEMSADDQRRVDLTRSGDGDWVKSPKKDK